MSSRKELAHAPGCPAVQYRTHPRFIPHYFTRCGSCATHNRTQAATPPQAPPTVAEAEAFIRGAEVKLNDLTVKASRASWVQSNFITDDTEIMSADANEVLMGVTTQLAKQATRFDHLQMPPALARKMLLLKLLAAVPAPAPAIPRNWLSWRASARRSRPTTARASTARLPASTPASVSTSARSSTSWRPRLIPMN